MDLPRSAVVVLLALGAGACASGRATRPVAIQPGGTAHGAAIVSQARVHAGTAYRSGGSTPGGFDCSGFVQYLYLRAGIALPRTAEAQFSIGQSLRARDLAAGDLVFFRTDGRRVSHVGIATGDGGFIHAPSSGSRVRVDRLEEGYWAERFAGGRRIVEP